MENVFMIAAGGTGGHFYPGFALGKELASRGRDVVFIIKRGSPNAKLLEENELLYQEIDFVSMPRGKNPFKWLDFIWKLILSILEMRRFIESYKPAVCIGMGGYISFPLIFTAHFMGVKTAVHDSNSKIGLANKVCSKFTDMFLLGLPVDKKIKNSYLVGTPIREEFRLKASVEEQNYWTFVTDFSINVLIFGGSGGARALSIAAAKTAKDMLGKTKRLHFLHITGTRDYEEIKNIYGDTEHVELIPYAEDIHALMKAAHIVISRAGASSLAEIYSMAKPAIVVPFPYASDDHQYCNAKIFADKGCIKLIKEGPNLAEDLDHTLRELLASPKTLKEMSANFGNLVLPSPLKAAGRIADMAEALAGARLNNF